MVVPLRVLSRKVWKEVNVNQLIWYLLRGLFHAHKILVPFRGSFQNFRQSIPSGTFIWESSPGVRPHSLGEKIDQPYEITAEYKKIYSYPYDRSVLLRKLEAWKFDNVDWDICCVYAGTSLSRAIYPGVIAPIISLLYSFQDKRDIRILESSKQARRQARDINLTRSRGRYYNIIRE